MNKGKQLEQDFKESCKDRDIWVYRIKDSYSVLKTLDPTAYVPQAPADYLVHNNGKLWFIECKETNKKFITIAHDGVKGMIREHQLLDLTNVKGKDVQGGFIFQFLKDSVGQQTYYMDAEKVVKCLQNTGKTSISVLDVVQYGGVLLEQTKLRTHYRFGVEKIFG